MGSLVRVIPLSCSELRLARGLVELVALELGATELRNLRELGLRRRRVVLIRRATGAWLYDAIEGSSVLVSLGPEAVWATSDSALDRWIAARSSRACAARLTSLPEIAPALDLRLPAVVWATRPRTPPATGHRPPVAGALEHMRVR